VTRWRHGDVEHRLDVTEPVRGHANHGLVMGATFHVDDRTRESVRLATPVGPAAGYPFAVRLVVRYAVNDDGLDVRYSATTLRPEPAPAAIGAHPYLRVGDVPVERLTLQLPVASRFTLDAGLIPVAEGPLTGDHAALPAGLPLGERRLNECYTRAGSSPARLVAPDGSAVELDPDDDFAFLQICVTDEFQEEAGPRRAVAVEPMSAPPDALNSGQVHDAPTGLEA